MNQSALFEFSYSDLDLASLKILQQVHSEYIYRLSGGSQVRLAKEIISFGNTHSQFQKVIDLLRFFLFYWMARHDTLAVDDLAELFPKLLDARDVVDEGDPLGWQIVLNKEFGFIPILSNKAVIKIWEFVSF